MKKNIPEKKSILESSLSITQLKRLLNSEEYERKLDKIFADHSILNYKFESEEIRLTFIVDYLSENLVLDSMYYSYIITYIDKVREIYDISRNYYFNYFYIYKNIFSKEFAIYYNLNVYLIKNTDIFYNKLEGESIESMVAFTIATSWIFDGENRELFINIVTDLLEETIESFFDYIPADGYDIDLDSMVKEYLSMKEYGEFFDKYDIIEDAESRIEELAEKYLYEEINKLPNDIIVSPDFIKHCPRNVEGVSALVENYLEDDNDYDSDFYQEDFMDRDIDFMFGRL